MAFDVRALAIAAAGFSAFVNLYSPQSLLPELAREFGVGAGGISAILKTLAGKKGALHLDCITVTGKTLGENIADIAIENLVLDGDLKRQLDELTQTGVVLGSPELRPRVLNSRIVVPRQ